MILTAPQWEVMLSAEQQEFVQALLVSGSVKQAADRTGLSYSTCLAYNNSPKVRVAIELERKRLRAEARITPEDVIQDLKLVRDIALGRVASPETKWVDGEAFTKYVYKTDLGAANKAIENMGRVVGMFTDKKEISMKVTDKQLRSRLEDLLGVDIDAIDGEFREVTDPPDSVNAIYEQGVDDDINRLVSTVCDQEGI